MITKINHYHCRWSSYQEGWHGPKLSHELVIDGKKEAFFSTALASSMATEILVVCLKWHCLMIYFDSVKFFKIISIQYKLQQFSMYTSDWTTCDREWYCELQSLRAILKTRRRSTKKSIWSCTVSSFILLHWSYVNIIYLICTYKNVVSRIEQLPLSVNVQFKTYLQTVLFSLNRVHMRLEKQVTANDDTS